MRSLRQTPVQPTALALAFAEAFAGQASEGNLPTEPTEPTYSHRKRSLRQTRRDRTRGCGRRDPLAIKHQEQ